MLTLSEPFSFSLLHELALVPLSVVLFIKQMLVTLTFLASKSSLSESDLIFDNLAF